VSILGVEALHPVLPALREQRELLRRHVEVVGPRVQNEIARATAVLIASEITSLRTIPAIRPKDSTAGNCILDCGFQIWGTAQLNACPNPKLPLTPPMKCGRLPSGLCMRLLLLL